MVFITKNRIRFSTFTLFIRTKGKKVLKQQLKRVYIFRRFGKNNDVIVKKY